METAPPDSFDFLVEGDRHVSLIVRQRPLKDGVLTVGAKEVQHYNYYIGATFRGSNIAAALICSYLSGSETTLDSICTSFPLNLDPLKHIEGKQFRVYSHKIGDRSKRSNTDASFDRPPQVVAEYLGESYGNPTETINQHFFKFSGGRRGKSPEDVDKTSQHIWSKGCWTQFKTEAEFEALEAQPGTTPPERAIVNVAVNLGLGYFMDTLVLDEKELDRPFVKANPTGAENRARVMEWGKTSWTILKHKIRRPTLTQRKSGTLYGTTDGNPYNAEGNNKKTTDRLIVVVSAHDLRQTGVNISYRISWERTMTDLIKYFQLHESSEHVFGLESARYIVVAFGPNALALFTRSKPGSIEAELIYSGTDIEGSIERDFPGERLSLDTRIVGTLAVALKKLCDSKAYSAEADEAKKNLMIKGMLLRALKLSNALRRMLFKFGYDYHDAMPRYPYATVEYIAGEKKRPLYQIDLSDFVKSLHEKLLDLDIEQDPNKFSDMANREHEAIKDICNDPYIEYPERIAHRTSEAKRYRHNYEFFKESFRQEWLNSDIADTVTSGDIIHVLASPGHTTTLDSYEDTWWSYLGLMIKKEYGRRYRVSAGKSEPEFSQLALIVESVAKEILEWGGPGADHIVPYEFSTPAAIFRHLDVFDRREIESLRSLGFVIEEYVKQTSLTKPLNLAVFGEPGSGKSFRIKQLLNSLESDQKWAFLTFNLSMFESVDSLISCFHKIQEAQLSGKMPVVFWDEFDTSLKGVPFGWLHAFLGPMQDGYYANATDEVNVRRCIFVFAGSRFKSFRDLPDPRRPDEALIPEMLCLTIEDLQNGLHDKFYSRGGGKKGRSQIGDHPGAILNQRREEWRVAKGGDFQSRLKGSLDVSEPNPDKELIIRYWKRDGRHDDPSNSDSKRKNAPVWRWDCLNYLIARARLLRNILQQKDAGYDSLFSEETRSPENSSRRGGADAEKSQHLRIDNEIAAAFIGPHIFKHGSRSVESIAQMSGLHNKVSYDRAWLPPSELIQHHVDARAFSSRTHSEDLRKLMWQEELSEWHREAKGTPLTDETKS